MGGQIGREGVAVTPLTPHGVVRVDAEEWSAIAHGRPIEPGEDVEVVARHGLRLRVRATFDPIGPATAKAERLRGHRGGMSWLRLG
jgi:membrane-bound ClpP family serine protease